MLKWLAIVVSWLERKQSVYTHLLEKNDKLQLQKVIHFCSRKAVEMLLHNLEFSISHSHNWFSHSALGHREHDKIYQLFNSGQTPLMLAQLESTRWLSIHDCCVHILALH